MTPEWTVIFSVTQMRSAKCNRKTLAYSLTAGSFCLELFFFVSLCIPLHYQKLGLFIWVTIALCLFSPLLGGTQMLTCASSHIKARVQSRLLTCPHSLEPSKKSFPPKCLKSGFVYTHRYTVSAHMAEFWHIWCCRSLWHQAFFWTSSSTAPIPSSRHQHCWALKKNYWGKAVSENNISFATGVPCHIKVIFSAWFQLFLGQENRCHWGSETTSRYGRRHSRLRVLILNPWAMLIKLLVRQFLHLWKGLILIPML